MLKEIFKTFFGSIGRIALSAFIFWSFYCSPAWFGFANKEGDVRGWGSFLYALMFFPVVSIAVFIHSIYVMKGVPVPHKSVYLGVYVVVMLVIAVLNFTQLDNLRTAAILAVAGLVFSALFMIVSSLLSAKYAPMITTVA